MATDVCPICKALNTEVHERHRGVDGNYYNCPNCGVFMLARSVIPAVQAMNEKERAVLSTGIWEKQKDNGGPPAIGSYFVDALKGQSLPNPAEQLDRLVLCLGKYQDSPGKDMMKPRGHLRAKIGALCSDDEEYIIKEARKNGLINAEIGPEDFGIHLTLEGWQRYEELKRGATHSQTAFMAMQFGKERLDGVLAKCFRPAVEETGFKLKRVDEEPRAGLIDDKLRVDIRMSRFLIADLTHGNQGAYWEAGFAEGLGKPVIYTCEKAVWDARKTHFDTNHRHTVIWEENHLDAAAEKLKATIRNTLPIEARMPEE